MSQQVYLWLPARLLVFEVNENIDNCSLSLGWKRKHKSKLFHLICTGFFIQQCFPANFFLRKYLATWLLYFFFPPLSVWQFPANTVLVSTSQCSYSTIIPTFWPLLFLPLFSGWQLLILKSFHHERLYKPHLINTGLILLTQYQILSLLLKFVSSSGSFGFAQWISFLLKKSRTCAPASLEQ